MFFNDRISAYGKDKQKLIRKVNEDGVPTNESFYAKIEYADDALIEGTPLSAEVFNQGNWRDDKTLIFQALQDNDPEDEYVRQEENRTKFITKRNGQVWLYPPKGKGSPVALTAGIEITDYKCLGVSADGTPKLNAMGLADNQILCQMSRDYFNNPLLNNDYELKIVVSGTVGVTAQPISGNGETFSNIARFFDWGVALYTGKRKLHIDFTNSILPEKVFSNGKMFASYFHTLGADITFTGAKIIFSGGTYSYVHSGAGSNFYKSSLTCNDGCANCAPDCTFESCELIGSSASKNGTGNAGNNCLIILSRLIGICWGAGGNGYGNNAKKCVIKNSKLIGMCRSNPGMAYGCYTSSGCKLNNSRIMALSPTGNNAFGYYSNSTSADTYHEIISCAFPLGVKDGFNSTPSKVQGINIGTSTAISCNITDCFVHSGFDTKIVSPINVDGKTHTGENEFKVFTEEVL